MVQAQSILTPTLPRALAITWPGSDNTYWKYRESKPSITKQAQTHTSQCLGKKLLPLSFVLKEKVHSFS